MTSPLLPLGAWTPSTETPCFAPAELVPAVARFREPLHLIRDGARGPLGVAFEGSVSLDAPVGGGSGRYPWLGRLPAIYPEWLGDRGFCETHNLRFAYIAGEMANGIATPALVIAMARAGMLGFFGAGGLHPQRVEQALNEIEAALGPSNGHPAPSWGTNLIHSPAEPAIENAVADLYIRRGVRRVCVSAFMNLTPAVARLAASGLVQNEQGRVERKHHIFAKISRPEVATAFMSPAPLSMLESLVRAGQITQNEAQLAQQIPVAAEITVESDSGGHTDNRPLGSLLPVITALRDEMMKRHDFKYAIRVGAAGGLGTPEAVAAAFAMGAAYVVTGSINQSTVEAGLSAEGKALLAQAGLADVIMAPAADMFELGVKVQVLKRGSLFGPRALRLYEVFRSYESLEAIPAAVREKLEREVLGLTCDAIWNEVQTFFAERDPQEIARAQADGKHKMALVFRWYLGLSSRWAIAGEPSRRADYQIWCGPAMGAFNGWVKGTFLEAPEKRNVTQLAWNLMEGAAAVTRAQQLRSAGVPVPTEAFHFAPRQLG
ncbi:MAG: PfaD family polyunsaturated fatty acid/polyketide biosynthesis protein [Deltaproteobacteria bacterium]|nr:PfaD family polyunsaturated fatty acid/polyketide biosynthesis protein [Deltaproteobacteria bacterium]